MSSTNLRQPRGLTALFLTEMWERFSYYGMRAMLVLYLVQGLHWTQGRASVLYGLYTGSVWLTPIIGGYIADRFLGAQKALLIGGTIIALGHFVIAVETMPTFYLGLALVALGTGLFKPNVSACVGELYSPDDPRRDPGFTIFYMGINLGALIGPLVTGYLRVAYGWRYGFGAAGVGMILAIAVLLATRKKYLGEAGLYPSAKRSRDADAASGKISGPLTREEWERVVALGVVSFFVIFFWAAYEQAGNTMNLFAAESTRLTVGTFKIIPEWFQSVDPVFIILLGPLFAALWTALSRARKEPSTTRKMALGLIVMGLGFVFMVAAAMEVKSGRLASPWWLVLAFMFHAGGELCLSPVGLSLVTKVAPGKIVSLMMGVWFLSNFAGNVGAGFLGTLTKGMDPIRFWTIFLVFPVVAGLILFFCAPRLQKLMHGRG
ncbi:MAG: peptide MFS transporter [Thermoanaerobaculia bacterium]